MILSVILLAFIAALCLPLAAVAVDSAADRSALTSVYHSMGGVMWATQTNWLAPNVSMCLWYGVSCQTGCPSNSTSTECRAVELDLASNGLRGPIAPELEQLVNLTSIVMGHNELSGTIPDFDTLSSLKWLDLNSASLTGSIPEFHRLVSLERLELFENRLQGTLPSFVTSVRLAYLDLSPCYELVGTLPSFSNLIQMKTLYLSQNQFIGTIPSYATLVQLTTLYISKNLLVGAIPSFETLTQLHAL